MRDSMPVAAYCNIAGESRQTKVAIDLRQGCPHGVFKPKSSEKRRCAGENYKDNQRPGKEAKPGMRAPLAKIGFFLRLHLRSG